MPARTTRVVRLLTSSVGLAFLYLLLSPPAHASTLHERIQRRLEAWFPADKPGVCAAALKRGEIVFLGARGLASLDAKTPLTPDSVFDLASVSKQFTAAAVLRLAEQGQLELRAPIARYVPDLALKTRGRPITVDDLLHHLSGLPDYADENDWKEPEELLFTLDTAKHTHWLNRADRGRRPGQRYEYNNSGYILLARVIELVSGQSYADYIERTFFQPLGMRSALVYRALGQVIPLLAQGYKRDKRGRLNPVVYPMLAVGDGNIFASVQDMVVWDNALRQGKVLKPETLRAAWTVGRLDNGLPIADEDGWGYGYGWSIDNKPAKRRHVVAHSGGWAGYSAYYHRDLNTEVTVITLCNQENVDLDELAEEIGALVH